MLPGPLHAALGNYNEQEEIVRRLVLVGLLVIVMASCATVKRPTDYCEPLFYDSGKEEIKKLQIHVQPGMPESEFKSQLSSLYIPDSLDILRRVSNEQTQYIFRIVRCPFRVYTFKAGCLIRFEEIELREGQWIFKEQFLDAIRPFEKKPE